MATYQPSSSETIPQTGCTDYYSELIEQKLSKLDLPSYCLASEFVNASITFPHISDKVCLLRFSFSLNSFN